MLKVVQDHEIGCPSGHESKLSFLLHPVTVDTFVTEYWEQKPLHIKRQNSNYFSSLFSLEDLDEFLAFSLTNEDIRMAKDGSCHHPIVEGADKTTICGFFNFYYKGSTIVVRNIHPRWEPIARMANGLINELGCQLSTHLYATPEESQGFGLHWDDHDIFALQLEGEKEWSLYDTGPQLPRRSRSSKEFSRQIKTKPGEPSQVIVLKAGDLLYFPRGTIHSARAQTKSSLHLTFGLFPVTWEDIFVQAIRQLSAEHSELSASLPADFLSAANAEALQDKLDQFAPLLLEKLQFGQAYSSLAADLVKNAPALPSGHFSHFRHLHEIEADTLVSLRDGVIAHLAQSGQEVALRYPGQALSFPENHAEALRFIIEKNQVLVRDIPLPGPEQDRVCFVRQLICKGFLKLVAPSEQPVYSN